MLFRSVSQSRYGQHLEKKGPAYGIETDVANGMDLLDVMTKVQKAVAYIRETGKPYFLVCYTYRFRAHSMFDAELYREKSEVEEWKKKDPIPQFKAFLLKEKLINEKEIEAMEAEVEREVQEAIDFAENGTWEKVEELDRFVYSEKAAI